MYFPRRRLPSHSISPLSSLSHAPSQLCPLNLAPKLAHANRNPSRLIIVVPPILALIEVDLELGAPLLSLGGPHAAEVEFGDLETAAVEGDEGRELSVLGGVGERRN